MNDLSPVSSTLESTAVAVANKATLTGSVVTVVSGITASDIGMWAGIAIGIVGLIISFVFKHRADKRYEQANKRYEEAHVAYMERLKKTAWVDRPPTPAEEVDA